MNVIYPGTFDPFTTGHFNVWQKSTYIFGHVEIIFADNPDKQLSLDRVIPSGMPGKFVHGDLVKYVNDTPGDFTIIRGLRNSYDLQYEQNYIRWFESLSKKPVSFVMIFCDKEYEHISSTALRSLRKINPEAYEKYIVK